MIREVLCGEGGRRLLGRGEDDYGGVMMVMERRRR
jgi:hypothetical protein